jgi:hypothetical protein
MQKSIAVSTQVSAYVALDDGSCFSIIMIAACRLNRNRISICGHFHSNVQPTGHIRTVQVHWQAIVNKITNIWDIQRGTDVFNYLIISQERPTALLMNWMVCIQKNIKALLVTSKNFGLDANTEKTKYIFLSREQNVGQHHTIRH